MESAIQKLPEDTESVLGIFDFGGAGPQNIDIDFARFLVSFNASISKGIGLMLHIFLPLRKPYCEFEQGKLRQSRSLRMLLGSQ